MTTTLSLVHERRAAVRAAGAKAPLLLLMHGVGSNERSMARLAPTFDARFEVLSVRSPLTLGPASFAWFHVQFTSQGPVIAADEAREGWELIARFVDEAVAAYDIDASQVYVGGFSQGGIMSLAAMLTTPARIAGAVCMSGRLLPEVLPFAADAASLRDKPVLIVHGVDDTKLGIAFARDARERLTPLGLALTYHELPMGHEVSADSLALVSEWLTGQLYAK